MISTKMFHNTKYMYLKKYSFASVFAYQIRGMNIPV